MSHGSLSLKTVTTVAAVLVGLAACADTTSTADDDQRSGEDPGKSDWFGSDEPYADMYHATASVDWLPIRGRIIEADPKEAASVSLTPRSQISQDEMKGEMVAFVLYTDDGGTYALGEATTDDEGYLDLQLDISGLGIAPGHHMVEVHYEGEAIGAFLVTSLARDRRAPVVRSDVDLTYLHTDFSGFSAMLKLLSEDASDKRALPAMELVYQVLRGDDAHPVTFLSGSPRFFKRTLEAKMLLDGIDQDGLVLKPFKDISARDILGFDWGALIADLKEQVGYKLYWLLRLRTQLPATTPEILMGDDSEADFVAYNVYTRILDGTLAGQELGDLLGALNVSSYWRDAIDTLAPGVVGAAAPIAIYINLTDVPGDTFSLDVWKLSGLTRPHHGAWPLTLDLFQQGLITDADVLEIKERLIALGADSTSLDDDALAADFVDAETIARF